MRRIWLVLGVLVGLVASVTPAEAADDVLFGQQHSYSVTLRGNGEAVVTARLVFTNHGDTPQKTFRFAVQGMIPSELAGYQQQIVRRCISYGSATVPKPDSTVKLAPICAQYEAPDYISWYPNTTSTYDKLTFNKSGDARYSVDLPKQVPAGESSAILLSYAGKGFVHSRLGKFDFDVQTLKVDERVKQASVAIDVDAGLYLEDPSSKVNYQSTATSAAKSALSAGASARSAELDALAYQVGQSGAVTREAKDLAAGETLSVKGAYADAAWKLHIVRLGVAGAAALVVLSGLVWLLWRRRHSLRARLAVSPAHSEPAPAQNAVEGRVIGHLRRLWFEPLYVGGALVVALVAAGLIWGLVVLTESSQYDSGFVAVGMGVLALMVFALVLFALPVWLAWHARDVRVGLVVFVWEIGWLVMVLMAYQWAILPLLDGPASSPDVIMPMSDGTLEGTKAAQ